MKNINQNLKLLILAITLSLGFSYVYSWTAPTSIAPGGNIATPINTATSSQVKTGGLGVTSLLTDFLQVGNSITASGTEGIITANDFCIKAGGCLKAGASGGSGGSLGVYKSDGVTQLGAFVNTYMSAGYSDLYPGTSAFFAVVYSDVVTNTLKMITADDRKTSAVGTYWKNSTCTPSATTTEYVRAVNINDTNNYPYRFKDGNYYVVTPGGWYVMNQGTGPVWELNVNDLSCVLFNNAFNYDQLNSTTNPPKPASSTYYGGKRLKLCGAGDCIIK